MASSTQMGGSGAGSLGRSVATASRRAATQSSWLAKMAANEQRTGRRRVPYVLIAPEDPEEIGRIAAEVYTRHYGRPKDLLRSFNLAGLGHLVSADRNANHGELLSYLFFAPEFAERLIELYGVTGIGVRSGRSAHRARASGHRGRRRRA